MPKSFLLSDTDYECYAKMMKRFKMKKKKQSVIQMYKTNMHIYTKQ